MIKIRIFTMKDFLSRFISKTNLNTKILSLFLVLGHILSYHNDIFDALTLSPQNLLQIYIKFYKLFTYIFVEKHFLIMIFNIISVYICNKLICPLWGTLELLRYFLLITITTGIFPTLYFIIAYIGTYNEYYLLYIRISGFAGYLAGISVAVKQIMPEHVLLSWGRSIRIRNTHVPIMLYLLTLILKAFYFFEYKFSSSHSLVPDLNNNITTLLNDQVSKTNTLIINNNEVKQITCPYPTMFLVGLFTSWIYLRFFQKHSNGTRGDFESGFAFASFFPRIIQPPIKVVCNTIYKVLIQLHICKRRSTIRRMNEGSMSSSVTITLPGGTDYDAERRRLKALKALNERMAQSVGKNSTILTSGLLSGSQNVAPFLTTNETTNLTNNAQSQPTISPLVGSTIIAMDSPSTQWPSLSDDEIILIPSIDNPGPTSTITTNEISNASKLSNIDTLNNN